MRFVSRVTFIDIVRVSWHLSYESTHEKPTIRPVWPATTLISLYIHQLWQGFAFIPLWIAWKLYKAHVISEDSDQTARMRRVIWVYADRTSLIVGFVVPCPICVYQFTNVIFEKIYLILNVSKKRFHMRTKNIWLDICIHTVCYRPSLSEYRIPGCCSIHWLLDNVLIRLCGMHRLISVISHPS